MARWQITVLAMLGALVAGLLWCYLHWCPIILSEVPPSPLLCAGADEVTLFRNLDFTSGEWVARAYLYPGEDWPKDLVGGCGGLQTKNREVLLAMKDTWNFRTMRFSASMWSSLELVHDGSVVFRGAMLASGDSVCVALPGGKKACAAKEDILRCFRQFDQECGEWIEASQRDDLIPNELVSWGGGPMVAKPFGGHDFNYGGWRAYLVLSREDRRAMAGRLPSGRVLRCDRPECMVQLQESSRFRCTNTATEDATSYSRIFLVQRGKVADMYRIQLASGVPHLEVEGGFVAEAERPDELMRALGEFAPVRSVWLKLE